MTKQEAWEIIKENRNWNSGQKSVSLAFNGVRTKEDDILDAKRETLEKAWKVVGENND